MGPINGVVVTGVCIKCGATCQLKATSYGTKLTVSLISSWVVIHEEGNEHLICGRCKEQETPTKRVSA